MKCCINGENLIRLPYLSAKLFKFEIQKCGQILCAHKPYFLMPGHILVLTTNSLVLPNIELTNIGSTINYDYLLGCFRQIGGLKAM